eukprot:TRINITY_DN228_c0_g1_i1.p1 TRINITY_DN228_c0_g1~~TRINITY_DN228_c0_g1_i1.p1  ORF type:complete len:1074 (-),score=395.24 TRINITY_DN228_c0_g1_i1:159-3380(-)
MSSKYQRIRLVGKGTFGKAYLVRNTRDGGQYIMKQIRTSQMDKQEREEAMNEVRVLASLNHPNIIQLVESFQDAEGELCIIMEFAEKGDVHDAIQKQHGRPFSEEQILDWFVQMCLALKHCHDRKILHRDIKTQNIFIAANNMIKLGDFGIARVLKSTMECAKTLVGTPYYLSPEICQEKPYNNKSDVWSMGCVLYELATLKHAFDAHNMKGLVLKILRGMYPPIPSTYSRDLRMLVQQMFERDPRKRPSINAILRRPFIQSRISRFLSASILTREGMPDLVSSPPRTEDPPIERPPIPLPPSSRPAVPGRANPPPRSSSSSPSASSSSSSVSSARRSEQSGSAYPRGRHVVRSSSRSSAGGPSAPDPALIELRRKHFLEAQAAAKRNREEARKDFSAVAGKGREVGTGAAQHYAAPPLPPASRDLEAIRRERKRKHLEEQRKREEELERLRREYVDEARKAAERNRKRVEMEERGPPEVDIRSAMDPASSSPYAAGDPGYAHGRVPPAMSKEEKADKEFEDIVKAQRKDYFENLAAKEANRRRLYEDLGMAVPEQSSPSKSHASDASPHTSAPSSRVIDSYPSEARRVLDEIEEQRRRDVEEARKDHAAKMDAIRMDEEKRRREAAEQHEERLKERERKMEEEKKAEEEKKRRLDEWKREREEQKLEEKRQEEERKAHVRKLMGDIRKMEAPIKQHIPSAGARHSHYHQPSNPPSSYAGERGGSKYEGPSESDEERKARIQKREAERMAMRKKIEEDRKEHLRRLRADKKRGRKATSEGPSDGQRDDVGAFIDISAPHRKPLEDKDKDEGKSDDMKDGEEEKKSNEDDATADGGEEEEEEEEVIVVYDGDDDEVEIGDEGVQDNGDETGGDGDAAEKSYDILEQPGGPGDEDYVGMIATMKTVLENAEGKKKEGEKEEEDNDEEAASDFDITEATLELSSLRTEDASVKTKGGESHKETETEAETPKWVGNLDDPTMDRFVMMGNTLRLPHVQESDSLAARVETLRMYLEEQLGFEKLVKLHTLMADMRESDDDAEIAMKIDECLDEQHMGLLSLVNQLIFCEDIMNVQQKV